MEKANLNFSDSKNTITSICWICSVISWLLFIITNAISFHWIKDFGTVWTFYRIPIVNWVFGIKTADNGMGTYPIQMQEAFVYIVFILLLIMFLVAFVIFMMKSTCKKDSAFFNEMFGTFGRFHFIPILCGAILFLIAETLKHGKDRNDRGRNIAGMIIVIIGLCSMIFIYIKTNLPGDWMTATIKKGAYSFLIALEWYYFCYDIVNLRINDESHHTNTIKTCGILFSIIIGLGALAFAFFFKDVVVACVHFIIYLGMLIFFFMIDTDFRGNYNKYADGIIDIIMAILLLVEAIFLIVKYKTECLK